jgi:hypothetical protein
VAGSATGATSATFTVTNSPATASKLAFTTQPSTGATIASGASTPFGVSVEDTFGNVETGDNATTVTLAIGSGPSGGQLSCTNAGGKTVTVAGGVAGFTCSLNKLGAYALSATSSPAHGSATSNSFNIVAGSPAAVSVASGSPQSAAVNTAFGSPMVALVSDAAGNPVSGATVTFTAPGSGASGTFANGTATTTATTAANGQATASTFTANTVAGSDSVMATVTGASSATFGLTNTPGSASKLVFTTQPSATATAKQSFSTQPVVAIQDQYGNTVTTSTASVALSLNNPGNVNGAQLSCAANPISAIAGLASFSGCSISKAGTFSLTATSNGLTSATSTNITVH